MYSQHVHVTLALPVNLSGCLVLILARLAHKFKRIYSSKGCEFINRVTHEPCTKSKLEKVSSELWSLVDVQCYYTLSCMHLVTKYSIKI